MIDEKNLPSVNEIGINNIDKLSNHDYKGYFIAYFDILGYESIITKGETEEKEKLLETIEDTIKLSKEIFSLAKKPPSNCEIKMKVFSDNFLLCTEKDYFYLITLIGSLQCALAAKNYFVRGSISYGNIIFNDDYIYGKGLIDAYKLELNNAIFPRIIIDDSSFVGATIVESKKYSTQVTTKDIEKELNAFYCIDSDRFKYLNYLEAMKDYKEKGEKDVSKFKDLLEKHAQYIALNLKIEDRSIKQKYQWCMNYHNKFCKKNGYLEYLIKENYDGICYL